MNQTRSKKTLLALVVIVLAVAAILATSQPPEPEDLAPSALSATVPIASIQGSGTTSPLVGERVEVSGVVTAVHCGPGTLGGFFLQDDSAAQPATAGDEVASDGVFISGNCGTVEAGQRWRVRGTVIEDAGLTTIAAQSARPVDAAQRNGGQAIPAAIPLPLGDRATIDWESLEGRLVSVSEPLVVVDTYNLARRGQLTLAPERLAIPTEEADPGEAGGEVEAVANRNTRVRISLDDGVTQQGRFPIPLLPALGKELETLRLGSSVAAFRGVVTQREDEYFVLPVTELKLQPAPRPPRPVLQGAEVTVASFNLLNYFTTIDDGRNGARGADSTRELERQRAKTVAALVGMEADVIGLMELENNLRAEQDLVAALNAELDGEPYAGVGLPAGFRQAPGGGDAIRVGLIYRRDHVQPVGKPAVVSDPAFANGRAPLVQQFRPRDGEATFTVIVNHFKSKGSRDASGTDRDQGDGQGAYNASRCRQARALADHVRQVTTSDPDRQVLAIGDFNAYSQEDPIDVLRQNGLVHLEETPLADETSYTYVYYGQIGCLDHAFATPALADRVSGVAIWHLNADEPRWIDYNQEYNPPSLYRPNPFRCSDHDPVLIGLDL